MVLSRRSVSPTAPAMDTLEPRLVLAAPTATYVSASNNDTGVFVVVDYRSDVGLNMSTIGNGDLIAARSGGPTLTGNLFADPTVQNDGSIRAIYLFAAPTGAWNFSDTGHYLVTSPNGQVQDTNGDDVGDGLIRDLSLWFTQPKAAVTSNTMRANDWLIVVNYTDDVSIDHSTIGDTDIRVEGAALISGITMTQKIVNSANNVTAVYRVPAPAGGWNYLHNGAYTIVFNHKEVKDNAGKAQAAHNLRTFPGLFFNAPAAVIQGGTTVTGSTWLIPIKFSGLSAIDPFTLTDSLVTVTSPNGFTQNATRTALTNNHDGTYTATYRVTARGGIWDYSDNQKYTVAIAPNILKDINNRTSPGANLRTFSLWFNNPAADILSANATTNDPSKFDVTIRFHDSNGINQSTITSSAINVTSPQAVTISLLSVTAHPDGGYRAVFRIVPATGDRLANGSYFINTAAGVVKDSNGVGINGGTLNRYGLWFA
jgi:hypothetical protein